MGPIDSSAAFDVAIAGGGVIGCAVARALAVRGGLRIVLLEKERDVALHQSGRNSGVIHAGYNQKPGSLKARFVVEGSRRLREFCRERGIGLHVGGILIVSQADRETEILQGLLERGRANGAAVEWVPEDRIADVEPHARGIAALRAPEGASFDAPAYVRTLAADARARGVEFRFGERVRDIEEDGNGVRVGPLRARVFVNAAGLYADRLAHRMGVGRGFQVVPFRGEYCDLSPAAAALVRSHIYPVPDPRFPFLGVHLSRRTDGRVTAGPGAVLATGRESYDLGRWGDRDLLEMAAWPGFWRMMATREFVATAAREGRKAVWKRAIWAEARELVPAIRPGDLGRRWSGIRAQLVSRDGKLVEDLVVEETPRSVHVLNAVSPALTCSLPFGEEVAARVARKL
ncbi:MAG: L-2-hydroxyglutarate oxidase [Planctomycetes bacterium]|nr:L-2-hydroxyglutarate oxidase [Planctomycetota bacterium]